MTGQVPPAVRMAATIVQRRVRAGESLDGFDNTVLLLTAYALGQLPDLPVGEGQ